MNFLVGTILFAGLAACCVWLWTGLRRERARARQLEADAGASVRDIERRRETMLELVPDALVTVDKDGGLLECNSAAERIFGWQHTRLVGMSLADLLRPTPFGPPTREQIAAQLLEDSASLGRRHEMTAVRSDGTEFPVELTFARARTGEAPTFVGHIREISERIRGETALFERASMAALSVDIGTALTSRDELRSVLQRCTDAMIWHLNVTLARIWVEGESPGSLQLEATAGYESTLPAPDAPPLPGTVRALRVVEERQSQSCNDLSTDGDADERAWAGEASLVAAAAHPLIAKGRVVGVLAVYDQNPLAQTLATKIAAVADGIAQFIERTRAEAQVREQAALLDKATDVIILRDFDGAIRYWNKSAERIYGWTAVEAQGRKYAELLTTTGETLPPEALVRTMQAGVWAGEFDHVARDGRKVTVDSRWTLVRSPDGTPRSVLIIDTDITAKKQLEEQFLRAQRLEIIGTLAGGVAHDLNNMLGPILNSAQLLRHSVTEERGHKWLAIMESNARRGADLVRQVLTFARGLGTERGLLQLKHLVREIDRMMQETFPASVVTVVELPKDPWLVWGDATQVHQVLLNLCVNARDAMPDGGKLTVSVSNVEFQEPTAFGEDELPPGRYVELAVRDTGTGMPAEVQQKIFDPFFTTKEPGKGTGLGLATVANIVKHHEGVIALESEPGKGTVFKIYLPAADLAELPESKTLTKEALTGHGEWILLIDDESSIREITRATLENYGYRVLSAAQGKEATTLFLQRRKDIAVVVADLLMPVMDGPATMQLFRRIDPDIKLLAISGNQSREEFAQLEGMANIPLLAKPFDSEDLLAAIRALIDKDKSPPPADSP